MTATDRPRPVAGKELDAMNDADELARLRRENAELRERIAVLERTQRPLTQLDVIAQLAEANGGEVRVIDAKAALIARGMTSAKRQNMYNQMNGLLERSDRFEKCGPGTYRLVED